MGSSTEDIDDMVDVLAGTDILEGPLNSMEGLVRSGTDAAFLFLLEVAFGVLGYIPSTMLFSDLLSPGALGGSAGVRPCNECTPVTGSMTVVPLGTHPRATWHWSRKPWNVVTVSTPNFLCVSTR